MLNNYFADKAEKSPDRIHRILPIIENLKISLSKEKKEGVVKEQNSTMWRHCTVGQDTRYPRKKSKSAQNHDNDLRKTTWNIISEKQEIQISLKTKPKLKPYFKTHK